MSDAEDLAQTTLATVLMRDDFQFETEADFLKVCYGFASRILKEARRQRSDVPLMNSVIASLPAPAPHFEQGGMSSVEASIYLREVLNIARNRFPLDDSQFLEQAAEKYLDREPLGFRNQDPNKLRVRVHRLRKKLATLVGWKES
jgi:hypothetical protein